MKTLEPISTPGRLLMNGTIVCKDLGEMEYFFRYGPASFPSQFESKHTRLETHECDLPFVVAAFEFDDNVPLGVEYDVQLIVNFEGVNVFGG